MSAKQSANEEQKKAAETANESAPNEKKPPVKKTALKSWLLGLVFLLALLAMAATAALGWLGYQQLIVLKQELAERPTHQALKAPLQNLSALNGLKESQEYLQQLINNQHLQLIDIQQVLVKSADPKPRDWQLAEVEYLLRLANQRLQLEEDIDGALTLLKTADKRLKQANVPGTLAVRSDLLADIEELNALPRLDKVSLVLSLQTLADKALSLEIQPLKRVPSLNLDAVVQPASELNWYQGLWQEVRGLVIIRKRELPLEALPFTDEELALRHQLSALLLQASWAALRSEQPLYTASLAAANKRLEGFDASQPEVQAFQKQLVSLAKQPVKQKLPNTETSLDNLQAFIAQRYSLKLPLEVEEVVPEGKNQEEQP